MFLQVIQPEEQKVLIKNDVILTTGIIFLGKSFYNANLINTLDFRYLYDLTKFLFDKLDIYELYLIQENVKPFWGKWSDNFILNNEML